MKVQNVMESYITNRTNALYDEFAEAKNSFLTCSCENCRMDTICYVLNRIHPKYVVSGRGMTYANLALNGQIMADIDAMIIDGMRIVNAAKRPYHEKRKIENPVENVPAFSFPVFMGAVYDGHTFEPMAGVTVELTADGKLVPMEDASWENPTLTYKPAKGSFTFKPAPLPASKEGETKNFPFTITIRAENYQPLIYSFTIPVTSSMGEIPFISLKLQDSYMFPVDEINSMEE
ncbi:MAG: late competence development ComFB family protein [Spirochaetaceae bacterium]|nr:late competence development ComFB family protein [Spirochaetaceae bacterium]